MEVQVWPDGDFEERMFGYNSRAYAHYKRPVASLAILGDNNPSWRPVQFSWTALGCTHLLRFPSAKLLDWAPQHGGLTMYGGRLSSLMVRSGRFRDGGELALRHIAGSSLDITEQGPAKIQIFGSSIRGLSISRRLGVPDEDGEIDRSHGAKRHCHRQPGVVCLKLPRKVAETRRIQGVC